MKLVAGMLGISGGLGGYVPSNSPRLEAVSTDLCAQDYDPEDLKGQSSPTFDLDRALKAHRIDEISAGGIELQDRSRISRDYHDAERRGELDPRDPVDIAGGEGRYVDLEVADARANAEATSSDPNMNRGGIRGSLKKRIGSLKKKARDE